MDDIIRYGSKELFADENDEAGKSRQIHYDDSAIDRLLTTITLFSMMQHIYHFLLKNLCCRLLDREHIGDEDGIVDEEEENSFLKNFKVVYFIYYANVIVVFDLKLDTNYEIIQYLLAISITPMLSVFIICFILYPFIAFPFWVVRLQILNTLMNPILWLRWKFRKLWKTLSL